MNKMTRRGFIGAVATIPVVAVASKLVTSEAIKLPIKRGMHNMIHTPIGNGVHAVSDSTIIHLINLSGKDLSFPLGHKKVQLLLSDLKWEPFDYA